MVYNLGADSWDSGYSDDDRCPNCGYYPVLPAPCPGFGEEPWPIGQVMITVYSRKPEPPNGAALIVSELLRPFLIHLQPWSIGVGHVFNVTNPVVLAGHRPSDGLTVDRCRSRFQRDKSRRAGSSRYKRDLPGPKGRISQA